MGHNLNFERKQQLPNSGSKGRIEELQFVLAGKKSQKCLILAWLPTVKVGTEKGRNRQIK